MIALDLDFPLKVRLVQALIIILAFYERAIERVNHLMESAEFK